MKFSSKTTIYCVVTPCSLVEVHGHFEETSVDLYRITRNYNAEDDNVVTCRMVRATKMTGSSSDDWIY
jgi:hypothetical protein